MQAGFLGGASGQESTATQKMQETRVRSLDQEDPLEGEMATHSSIFAWITPWTEEPVHSVAKTRTRLKQLSMQQVQ